MRRVVIKGDGRAALAYRALRQGCFWAPRWNSIRLGQASSAHNALRLDPQTVVKSLDDTLTFIENTPVRA